MMYKPDNFSKFFMLPDPTARLLVDVRCFECTKVYLGGYSQVAVVKEPSRKTIRGFKAFNRDWTCRCKQYEVGKTFKEDIKLPIPCENGMHFCLNLTDIFYYYDFDLSKTRVAEVEATGDVTTLDAEKFCTNELKIVREVEPAEILDAVRDFIYWALFQKLPNSVLGETLFKLEGADYRFCDKWRKSNDK